MKFISIADAKRQTGLSYLGSINSSAKLVKNKKVSNNYTYILYLSPDNTSGYNVCIFSTKECRLGCLATSGRAGIEVSSGKDIIKNARLKKTRLFFEHKEFFMAWVVAEMTNYKAKAIKDGYDFSVRLNGTSDIEWEHETLNGKTLFELFPDTQFYDYTKNPKRAIDRLPNNYHITLSYTGENESIAIKTLKRNKNVAVIFNIKKTAVLPETWNGFKVVDGDLTDYRPNDGNGVVVGLRWKNIGDKKINNEVKHSKFVVQVAE